ncbi:MAG: histidine kinase [Acholeplasmataceae bacterium]|jgi:signal transduction histidine kinase|nr:histidine kinase [Acholeplasmataceae bacterium]
MPFFDIFPIIIPGLICQLSIQFYYIYHQIRLKDKVKTKIIYSLLILILGLPYIAFLHYLDSKRDNQKDYTMDQQSLFYLILFAYQIFALQYIYSNMDHTRIDLIHILIGIIYILIIMCHIAITNQQNILFYTFGFFMVSLSIWIELINTEYSVQLILIIALSLLMMHLNQSKMRLFALLSFILITVINILKAYRHFGTLESNQAISVFVVNLVAAALSFFIFYSFKNQKILNQQLENMNVLLLEQQNIIEKLSIDKERERISHEIHDAVGHYLTTALITLESLKPFYKSDKKIEGNVQTVSNYIRTSLNDIRSLVHNMQLKKDINFNELLDKTCRDLSIQTNLKVNCIVEVNTNPPIIYTRFFINCIREFITNSLKHGSPHKIDILFSEINDLYHLSLSDDGMGSNNHEEGFGLMSMRNTTEGLGGKMTVTTSQNDGFTISLKIPKPHEIKRG